MISGKGMLKENGIKRAVDKLEIGNKIIHIGKPWSARATGCFQQ